MKFGVFDHMDRADVPLGRQYAERLQLIEAYDRGGFHAYHLAEHHATPLGMAPSPSVFLAAVAQRTTRLRFGPLVYTLALYHPIRLLEEICMLDQMSGGRLELGVGRGISPFELGYYGADAAASPAIYAEALSVILQGLTHTTLNFTGRHFNFRDVPVELQPVQRPHPPLWYGVGRPDSVVWTAENKVNIVCGGDAARVRGITDRYRSEWAAAGNDVAAMPLLGMTRHIVLADTDAEALAIARRAYQPWYRHLMQLWLKHGSRPTANFPADFEQCRESGQGFAGSPATMRDALRADIAGSGATYFVCRFAFGDMTLAESQHSLDLFTHEVMPALTKI
jgi:alkanesulfonate monooxygenase SsuD/methylene tetrahydromethanopterin reductase-like flavin-dependent oxidoreductase (luciferase family)